MQELIDKADSGIPLSKDEQRDMKELLAQEPDCLVYDSHARQSGENYIFFEKGFRKLALRQLRLRFCRSEGGSYSQIVCADTCDYTPYIESYGEYFMPKAKVRMDESYLNSDEYLLRKQINEESHRKLREAVK